MQVLPSHLHINASHVYYVQLHVNTFHVYYVHLPATCLTCMHVACTIMYVLSIMTSLNTWDLA